MKYYVSGALQGSDNLKEARAVYERAGKAIQTAGAMAYVPHTNTDPETNVSLDSHSVFRTDLDEIKKADALVVFLNEPSLGVGAEIAIALSMGKQLLPVVFSGKPYSRFVGGMLEAHGVSVQQYKTVSELEDIIAKHVSDHLAGDESQNLCNAV
ncbi:nucleoside 2-deoxyribosyltransferase [uncultured Roseobacter sp.]|uniref:nucleoside 2-deoxyribosyltransferase n=1 Tax=uncultured Roseobacter sp. TaxID=114847 RepID=UPI00261A069F|nr:nucleoside 2-deoxyribosyltransferase [uncultured Roseobacter sp.]